MFLVISCNWMSLVALNPYVAYYSKCALFFRSFESTGKSLFNTENFTVYLSSSFSSIHSLIHSLLLCNCYKDSQLELTPTIHYARIRLQKCSQVLTSFFHGWKVPASGPEYAHREWQMGLVAWHNRRIAIDTPTKSLACQNFSYFFA